MRACVLVFLHDITSVVDWALNIKLAILLLLFTVTQLLYVSDFVRSQKPVMFVLFSSATRPFCGASEHFFFIGHEPFCNVFELFIGHEPACDVSELFIGHEPFVMFHSFSLATNPPVMFQSFSLATNPFVMFQSFSLATNEPACDVSEFFIGHEPACDVSEFFIGYKPACYVSDISLATNPPVMFQSFSLATNPPVMLRLARHAKDTSKTFCLNLSAPFLCSRYKDTMSQLLPYVHYLFGNEAVSWRERREV